MSQESACASDDFKLVSYKRNSSKLKADNSIKQETQHSPVYARFNKETVIRRITEAKEEIPGTHLFDSFSALLREGLSHLNNPEIREIVCFGLGKIGECLTSRYQFALLLCLRDIYNVEINVYDPIFTENDRAILEQFKCTILNDNLEGKFHVKNKSTTLFYLPHCAKQLTNNLLWANWGLNLNYCIIVANSFDRIVERSFPHVLKTEVEYITNISPYVVELAIVNNFKYFEVFNDTAIHVFPENKLKFISNSFWTVAPEPVYTENDLEFIRNQFETVVASD